MHSKKLKSYIIIWFILFGIYNLALPQQKTIKQDRLIQINKNLQDSSKQLKTINTPIPKNKYVKDNLSWSSLLIKTSIVLIIIIILIYFIFFVLKKNGKNKLFGSVLPSDIYKILGSAPLSYNKYLSVIKFYDTIYLLAFSENGVSVIDKIDNNDKTVDIENLIPYTSQDMPDKFLKLLKKNMKTLKKNSIK